MAINSLIQQLRFLSESTNGKQIKITETATPGNALHIATSGGNEVDVVTIEAINKSGGSVLLTIEFGGVASPDDHVEVTIPARTVAAAPTVVLNQRRINGGLTIAAFAASANVIEIYGEVGRYPMG